MKKIYLQPDTASIKVVLTTMIADSTPEVGLSKDGPAKDPGSFDSRRRGQNFWDDDEDM